MEAEYLGFLNMDEDNTDLSTMLPDSIPLPSKCPNSQFTATNCQPMMVQLQQQMEIAAFVFVLLLSIFSNLLVFLLFYRRPSMRTSSNRFVLNLSVTHLFQSLFMMPTVLIGSLTGSWAFGDTWCQLIGSLNICLNVASVLSILLIAIDRNCAVNNPLHYSMTITKQRTGGLIASTWIVSILLSLPPSLGVSRIDFRPEWRTCFVVLNSGSVSSVIYGILLALLGFLIPLVLISWIYLTMFRAAKMNSASARKLSVTTCASDITVCVEPKNDSAFRKLSVAFQKKVGDRGFSSSTGRCLSGIGSKAVRTGLLVVGTFTFCWLPYYVCILFEPHSPIPENAYFFVALTSFCACVINPYLYVFRNKTSRKHVRKLLDCHGGTKRTYFVDSNIQPRSKQARNLRNCANDVSSFSNCVLQITESKANVTTDITDSKPRSKIDAQKSCSAKETVTSLQGDKVTVLTDLETTEQFSSGNCSEHQILNGESIRAQIFYVRTPRTFLHQDSTSSSDSSDVGTTVIQDSTLNIDDDSVMWYSQFQHRRDSLGSDVSSSLPKVSPKNKLSRTGNMENVRTFLCLKNASSMDTF